METIKYIAFDADDTLWVNEPIFRSTEQKCKEILAPYIPPSELSDRLYETEMKNLKFFGYGIKSFMLSLIETVVELSDNKVNGKDIQQIIDLGKEMVHHPVELLDHVEDTVSSLKEDYTLMILTKGDLFDQESKIARSGLGSHFDYVEIVSKKNEDVYSGILSHYAIEPSEFLMIGNSLKSDVLPVSRIGGHAVHIPFHTTWAHETIEPSETEKNGYHKLDDISQVRRLLKG